MLNTNPLAMIADNPVVFEALSELLRSKFDEPDTYVSLPANASNELLGQITRARIEGLMKVEDALLEIARCASVQNKSIKINPAR